MPVGLDGNPNPIVTDRRTATIERAVDLVGSAVGARVLIGVYGRSGVGKSTFADELASALRRSGRDVVRSTTDLFHHPRSVRLSRGATSPDGYYEDSHQLELIVDGLRRRARCADSATGCADLHTPRRLRRHQA